MTTSDFQIMPLQGRHDLLAPTARLITRTWPAYYGKTGTGNAVSDLRARCVGDKLPRALVALADDDVIGTGTLAGPSYGSKPGEEPWIIGLCVIPEARRTGIATALILALENEARRMDFAQMHATTISAQGLLLRLGYACVRNVTDSKGVWRIMRKNLT